MIIRINNQQSTHGAKRRARFGIGNRQSERGFSLTEVVIAIGILAVGMLFIAGSFPVSIHFTTVATERTIAPTVADEAFAKLRFYGPDFKNAVISPDEFAYPSTPTDLNYKQYWWSFLYNQIDPNTIDVFVFVFRKTNASSQYWFRTTVQPTTVPADAALLANSYPELIYVGVSASPSGRADEIAIRDLVPADGIDERTFINDGYTIVDDSSGRMYRVLERYLTNPNVIRLDKDWVGTLPAAPACGFVWVTSPPVSSGRHPCIGVYRKTLRF